MHAVIAEKRAAIADVCRRLHVRRLDLFGSAATDRSDIARSDVDLIVEFEPMPPLAYAHAWDALQDGLETVLQRRVDLVSAKMIVNPFFLQSIRGTRETVYDSAA